MDLHRLEPGRPCRLGGVTIPSDMGPRGHSDGDAVLHAICDAVLGAAGLDDLGSLFPDGDRANEGRDSAEFCAEALRLAARKGLKLLSLDVVVEAERPRIRPHRPAIRSRLSELFEVPIDRVNVKGKTGEGLGAIGRGEALRATAVVLLGPRT
ncbi:MAG: 2-C-methyl-D-erythritol 2,4-cyclodiphosphate synthase [Planctomycetota bacterium]